jgi:serine/threonine-protein kinase
MEIGERIAGRYKISKMIGQGGMAKVYLARDLILDRDVAVKLMAYDFHNDEDSIRRFKREALSTTELVHPNIVNIYDVEEADNPYIVMEYVEGKDLKKYIHDHHPIPYKKSLAIMQQILEAVEYAHSNGIIHRDLKPQNILIDHDGNVKITDFGIAVALSQNSITQTNSLLGSVHYLSPEQARGSMATKQSDIYSLGILLYELLTGDVPFDGESAVSIALKHFQNPLPSLKQIDHRIPQPLENVVLKATAKDANQRYESVAEMKEDLRTSLSPERSGEPRFEPRDPNEEDTRVIEPIPASVLNAEDDASQEAATEQASDKEAANEEKKPKKKKRWWIWVLLVLLLLGGLVAAALYASRPQEVQVPELEGLTVEEAEQELEELNLLLGEIIERNSEEHESGTVIESNPSAGSTIRENNEVDLYVSIGQEPYTLEDYTGEPYQEVRALLVELGFEVVEEQSSSDTVEEGHIIEQDIDAGEEVIPTETTITFVVSTGRASFSFDDLTGMTRSEVDAYVSEHNLNLTVETQPSNEGEEGTVISQQPEAGSTLYANSGITVVFSSGPEEPDMVTFTQLVTIPYQAPEEEQAETDPENEEEVPATDPQPNHIQIFIVDANNDGQEPFHDFEITSTQQLPLSFTVEEGAQASYRIERDGEVIEEETVEP